MSDGDLDRQYEEFIESSQELPKFTIVTDSAIAKDEGYKDAFMLDLRVGPIFDIVRHYDTVTPMAAAIYGRWGSGKTSAMRWLGHRFDAWNALEDTKTHARIRHVWFDPWKYATADEVRRGIIGQVILATLKDKDATYITEAARRFRALGRGFIESLRGLKVSVGGKATGEAGAVVSKGKGEASVSMSYDVDALVRALEVTDERLHPERIYLNEFEESLREWISKILEEDGERLVVFIDDLDRCLPNVALRVLEAIKLYLNIERLIFIVGVDRIVVGQLVKKFYEDLGVDDRDSANYLAKMFQVEIELKPTDEEIRKYLDVLLAGLDFDMWSNLADQPAAEIPERGPVGKRACSIQEIFVDTMRLLAGDNPREIKRILNSALIRGAGAERVAKQMPGVTFASAFQVFLIQRVLEHPIEGFPGQDNEPLREVQHRSAGRQFLEAWSVAIRESGFITPEEIKRASARRESEGLEDRAVRPGYESIFDRNEYREFIPLLASTRLAELLRAGYSIEAASLVPDDESEPDAPSEQPPVQPKKKRAKRARVRPERLAVREDEHTLARAVASFLHKDVASLTPDDYESVVSLSIPAGRFKTTELVLRCARVRDLDLASTAVSDLTPLGLLAGLQELNLSGSLVADVTALGSLVGLHGLYLRRTRVADVTALRSLAGLQVLYLGGTLVADVTALGSLVGLQRLDLAGTQVADVTALGSLAGLQELDLRGTQVADVTALGSLVGLHWLDLGGTQVADVTALGTLAGLRELYLGGTQVVDVTALGALAGLQVLDLRRTQVADVTALGSLTGLQALDLHRTEVSQASVGALNRELPNCRIYS